MCVYFYTDMSVFMYVEALLYKHVIVPGIFRAGVWWRREDFVE